jgi:hypothetical protein
MFRTMAEVRFWHSGISTAVSDVGGKADIVSEGCFIDRALITPSMQVHP